ncbi:MAG: iron chelate uptake ABC transporter family permease subunit [Acidobacteriota bacterium]
MNEVLSIMLPPFVACLILTGIHTYLGLHVVSRGVIFVDLALAQIAALGSTFAFLLGFDPTSRSAYFYSLGFTFLGAAIFSLSRLKDKKIPQEALIGITFAVASSAAILIADRAPQGAEHVEQMLTGSILWINWPTIWKTLAIYSGVGLFHYLFREKFLLISMNPSQAEKEGIAVRWWDFLFYMSFGFVITSSVAIAGVLLVFSFLIVPSVIAMIFSARIGPRLIIGWAAGTLVSLAGLYCSYALDFPSGPSVVCSFGAFLILSALGRYAWGAQSRSVALARIGVVSVVLVAFLILALEFRPTMTAGPTGQQTALQRVAEALRTLETSMGSASEVIQTLESHRETLKTALEKKQLTFSQTAVQRLGKLGDPALISILRTVDKTTEDPWTRFYAEQALVSLGDKEAIHALIRSLKDPSPPFLKSLIVNELRQIMGESFGYDPLKAAKDNERAINRIEVWWHEHTEQLAWDGSTRSFRVGDPGGND